MIPEEDPYVNPVGAKGIGEIGIVAVAAAIANAVYHATGKRVRDLPITIEKVL
jgi:xanthine dehydrogenase YagR molybdenum-binding subunit